ncbi:MAG: small ribosomal subunit Rsm22 family protein [Myxococcales bacterium]
MTAGKRRGRLTPSPGSRIHQGLVGARALIGTPYLADGELRAAYARDIAPRTHAALTKILADLLTNGHLGARGNGDRGPRRMLDLGAGTGAAGEAARACFGGDLDLVSVDKSPVAASVRAADVTDLASLSRMAGAGGPFDLMVAAHVLNELFLDEPEASRPARLAALLGRWCQSLLADGGALIVIEPALRETSRVLLGVRDQLLAAGLHVVAPCFFTGPCPALLRERDWCHDAAAPAAEPARPAEREESRAARTRPQHRVDFSYLVVRASGEAASDSTLFRVVSDPLPEKGRSKVFVCGVSGRQPLIRLDRHAAPTNAALDQLARGDVAHIARTTFAQDGLRVGVDTVISRPAPHAKRVR